MVFVELTSGFLQGYYLPLFGALTTHFSITDADITWFTALQSLAAGVCVPVLAKLGDIAGHRRVLVVAVLAVLAGTLVTALSSDYRLVLAGRVLVGPLAVWLPLEVALVHHRLDGVTARRAVGMLVSALTLGAVVGTLAAGALASVLDLTAVLLVPAVLVAACAVVVLTVVPESTVRTHPHVDVVGFAGLAVVMVALLWGLRSAQTGGFAAATTVVPLAAALVVLVGWVAWERRTEVPAVNLRLLTSRALWPVYSTSFLFGMVLFGTQTVLTTFLTAEPGRAGYGFALTPGRTALVTALSALTAAVGASAFPALARRVGMPGVLAAGCLAGAAGNLLLLGGNASLPLVVVAVVVSGLGSGLLLGCLPAYAAEASPPDQTGIATGVYNSLKTLGGAAAGAVFGVVLAAFAVEGSRNSSLGGYETVWAICAGAFLLCLPLLAVLRGRRAETTGTTGTTTTTTTP
nr:MFS transporter [Kineococcus siccus]